jgi:hypothetical protein
MMSQLKTNVWTHISQVYPGLLFFEVLKFNENKHLI